MVTPVTRGAVAVQIRRIAGQQRLEGEREILFGARTRLEYRHPGGRMGHEDLEETITTTTTEVRSGRGDVGSQSATGGELEEFGVNGVILP